MGFPCSLRLLKLNLFKQMHLVVSYATTWQHTTEMEHGKFRYTLVIYPNMHITHNIHPLLHKSEPELMNLMKSMLVSSLA